MNILAFLTLWASRVIEWFQDLYVTARSIVINWGGWMLYIVGQAVSVVYSTIREAVENAIAIVRQWVYDLYSTAMAVIGGIRDWLIGVIYGVRDWLIGLIQGAIDLAHWLYGKAIELINSAITAVRDFIYALIRSAIEVIQSGLAWLYGLRDKLLELVGLFTVDRLAKFIDLIERIYPTLLQFMANPVLFILDLIRDRFISFLCMVLAYGLGTTRYELPAFQSWKDR